MYHVHENVVVVGIDLSGFSMYYLFKKKIRFVVGIENVVVVVCTQQAAGKRNPPALPALPNGNGKQPHAWFLPLGTGGNGGSKKIPDGGFLALGMLPSASKVGLKWVGWGAIHRSKLFLQILCFRPKSVQQISSYV